MIHECPAISSIEARNLATAAMTVMSCLCMVLDVLLLCLLLCRHVLDGYGCHVSIIEAAHEKRNKDTG
jgi:hypothetical protein